MLKQRVVKMFDDDSIACLDRIAEDMHIGPELCWHCVCNVDVDMYDFDKDTGVHEEHPFDFELAEVKKRWKWVEEEGEGELEDHLPDYEVALDYDGSIDWDSLHACMGMQEN